MRRILGMVRSTSARPLRAPQGLARLDAASRDAPELGQPRDRRPQAIAAAMNQLLVELDDHGKFSIVHAMRFCQIIEISLESDRLFREIRVKMRRICCAIGVWLVVSAPSGAAILHNEAFDGDLADFNPASAFDLSVGLNTVLGRLSGPCDIDDTGQGLSGYWLCVGDQDVSLYALPAGLELSRVSISVSDLSAPDGFEYLLVTGGPGGAAIQATPQISGRYSGEGVFEFAVSSGAGPETFELFIGNQWALAQGDYSFDWRIDLEVVDPTVQPIPTPFAGPMLLTALGGLALARRRRQAR